jgi:DDE superfamily endonuclease
MDLLLAISRRCYTDKQLHLIVDNYATHKHHAVQRWLKRHPRFHIHFTPTSASWLNMVERRSLRAIAGVLNQSGHRTWRAARRGGWNP